MSRRPDLSSKPPARVRYLAAAAHVGFWAGALPLHVSRQTYDLQSYVGPLLVLLALFAFTPVAAALLVARGSAWRWFLVPHAASALVVHVAAAVAALTIALLDPMGVDLPGIVEVALWTAVTITLIYWLILPFGAAFRAKDGDRAWYPLLGRFTEMHPPAASGDPRLTLP